MTPEQRAEALQLARESVSLLGAQKHMDTINRALDEFLLRILAAEPEATPEPVVFVKYRKEGGFWSECHHLDTSAVPVFFHPPKEQQEKQA